MKDKKGDPSMKGTHFHLLAWLLVGPGFLLPCAGRADEDKVPSQDLRAGGDKQKRYFLFGSKEGAKPPIGGYGLVIVLPGGDGSEDFRPFVGKVYQEVFAKRYLVAQPVAVSWDEDQKITWPTKTDPVEKMKFTTEEFVAAVIKDVGKKHKLNPKHVFTLSWSSGGPAAYAVSLTEKTPVRGSLVAMSVFVQRRLPPLKNAKGQAYYLLHSEDDKVCRFFFARLAVSSLKKNGAKVTLATYEGGHGWHGDVYGNIRKGIAWLEKNSTPAKAK
jgi:predicted esterase